MAYQVQLTPEADEVLQAIADRRMRELILRRVERLSQEPDRQGSPLAGTLAGYRSVRAAGQRYRIIYRIEEERATVVVVGVGIRRGGDRQDIYNRVWRFVHLGFIYSQNGRNR